MGVLIVLKVLRKKKWQKCIWEMWFQRPWVRILRDKPPSLPVCRQIC